MAVEWFDLQNIADQQSQCDLIINDLDTLILELFNDEEINRNSVLESLQGIRQLYCIRSSRLEKCIVRSFKKLKD